MAPPSVCFSSATCSVERRIVIGPQSSTSASSVRPVETTYLGSSLYAA
ncbi:Uncharacterised protein [Mycobacteroides abscessus subsp. abscessus]|nr:Uncharacterised protein [Mycobacteroides abscessus subsp. abscessus]